MGLERRGSPVNNELEHFRHSATDILLAWEFTSTCMPDRAKTTQSQNGKSSGLWLAAAWVSFFAWLFHSFAVRAFFDSLHGAGKLLGGH